MSDVKKISVSDFNSISSEKKLLVESNLNNISDIEKIDFEIEEPNESAIDIFKNTCATAVVGFSSIASGILKVGEWVDDGITWVQGTVSSEICDLVGADEIAFEIREKTKEEIAIDKIGELNNLFYEQTTIGNTINNASYLKYDSKIAKSIQDISTKVAEFSAATLATIATGGTAAPVAFAAVFGLGATEGVGKSAEKRYQDSENDSYDTGAILLDGIGNGFDWYAKGKLGQGGLSAFKAFNNSISEIGATGTLKSFTSGIKNISEQFNIKNLFSKDSLQNIIKNGLLDFDQLVDSMSIGVNNITNAINNNTDIDWQQISKEIALAYGLNCVFAGFTNLFSKSTINDVEELTSKKDYFSQAGDLDDLGEVQDLFNIEDIKNELDKSLEKYNNLKEIMMTDKYKTYLDCLMNDKTLPGYIDPSYYSKVEIEFNELKEKIPILQNLFQNSEVKLVDLIDNSIRNNNASIINLIFKNLDSEEFYYIIKNIDNTKDIAYLTLNLEKEQLSRVLSKIDNDMFENIFLNCSSFDNQGEILAKLYESNHYSERRDIIINQIKDLIDQDEDISALIDYTILDDVMEHLGDQPIDWDRRAKILNSIHDPEELKSIVGTMNRPFYYFCGFKYFGDMNAAKKIANSMDEDQIIYMLNQYINRDKISEDLIELINLLDDRQQLENIKNGLEGNVVYKLFNDYHFNSFFDEKIAKVVKYSELEMINTFHERLNLYVPFERIEQLKGTVKFYSSEKFKEFGKKPGVMGFNNGVESKISLEYDENEIISNITHESIHQLSANNALRKHGLKYADLNIGINECATEYINEIISGDKYYTKLTGKMYCGYQPGVEKLKELVNIGVINEEQFIESYFSNNINYFNTQVTNLCGEEFCKELLQSFDDAISGNAEIKNKALADLSCKINVLKIKQKQNGDLK